MKVGHVLCTDGKVMQLSDFEQSDKEAVAVVFHVNHSENIAGTGYAVYLWEVTPEALADSLGFAQGTSADITAYDGNANTFALYGSGRGTTSPLAQRVFDVWHHGQSAFIPSVTESRLLYAVKSVVNPIIERLGGEPLPSNEDDSWYWTSTEVDGQQTAKAWLYSFGSGAIQKTSKLQAHKARPIITIYN